MYRKLGNKVGSGFRFWLESQGLAKDTVRNYYYGANIWMQWCEENDVSPQAPKRTDIQAYLGELLQVRAHSNVELLKIALRRWFSYLTDTERYTGPNPVANLPLRHRETEPPEPFTREELTRMYMACANHQERAVFLLLVGGGLRRSEIYGIRRDDINLEAGSVRVLGKGHQYRYNAPGMAVLEACMEAMRFSDRLCPQGSIDVIWRIVKSLAKRAHVRGRVYPHRFRHSFAVLFLEHGGTIDDLMHILGHKRIEQSMYYSRAGAKRRAIQSQSKINIAETMLDIPLLAAGY